MRTHGTLVAATAVALAGAAQAQISVSPDLLDAADVTRAGIQRLALPAEAGEPFAVDVELFGGSYSLFLEPYSVRSAQFEVLVQGADGEYTAHEPAAPTTYRGVVEGAPDSIVGASLIDGQLHAIVRLAGDLPIQGIQPVTELDASAGAADHLVYDVTDLEPLDVFCGSDVLEPSTHDHGVPTGDANATALGSLKACEIAVDADFEYYTSNGSSVATTQADVENIINGVAAIYTVDVGMTFQLTTIIVRSSEPDPYGSSGASTLLNQFTNHWTGSQGAVQRDIAHLFTGKNLSGSTIGIAWLNSVCGNSNGYGVSQSKFTGNFASRVALTAHEIGHNFNAGHCNGAGSCAIMCSGLGGCSGNITSFYSGSKNTISNKINASGCIDDAGPAAPPTITGLSKGLIGAYEDGELVISGTNFVDVISVSIGGTQQSTTKMVTSFGSITLIEPVIKEAGLQEVVVVTAAGAAGGTSIFVQEETNIRLDAPGLGIPGTAYLAPWSGGAGNFYSLSFSLDGGTSLIGGLNLLTNGNVALTGFFGSAGVDCFLIPNLGSLGFLTLFLQTIVVDGVSGSTLGASDVTSTVFF